MFHRAVDLKFGPDVTLLLAFEDGAVKEYDMSGLFGKYPQLKALKNRALFLSGKLIGGFGIIWNDELDLETETVYEEGKTVGIYPVTIQADLARTFRAARAEKGISQKELAAVTGIDQSDISKLERGLANPSVRILQRLAEGLGMQLSIQLLSKEENAL